MGLTTLKPPQLPGVGDRVSKKQEWTYEAEGTGCKLLAGWSRLGPWQVQTEAGSVNNTLGALILWGGTGTWGPWGTKALGVGEVGAVQGLARARPGFGRTLRSAGVQEALAVAAQSLGGTH